MPLYKSLLIVERGETCIPAKHFAKDMLGIWFDDEEKIWHWKSPEDKIIIVYPSNNFEDEEIRPSETSGFNFSRKDHIGHIKLYCNGNHIKVYNFKFSSSQQATEAFKTLKKYCISTIRKLGLSEADIDQRGFYIHWDLPGATDFLNSISFINTGTNLYKFYGKEIPGLTGVGGSWSQLSTQVVPSPNPTANLPFSAFTSQAKPQQTSMTFGTQPTIQTPQQTSMTFGTQPTIQTPQNLQTIQPSQTQQTSLFQQPVQQPNPFQGFGTATTPVKKDSNIFGSSQLGTSQLGSANTPSIFSNFGTQKFESKKPNLFGSTQVSNPFGGDQQTSNQGFNFNVGTTQQNPAWSFPPK